MNKIYTFILLVFTFHVSFAQVTCSDMALSVSTGSSPTAVQLYHPGMYLVWPRTENVIEWEITDFQGNIVHRDTSFGNEATGQTGLMAFSHNVPTTDSMKVSTLLYNDTVGIACLVEDTLFWKETEVAPGVYTYSWAILSGNTGINVMAENELQMHSSRFSIFPSPASNNLNIVGPEELYSFTIQNISGQEVHAESHVSGIQNIDITRLPAGHYFMQLRSRYEIEILRFVKQ